jgi:hypothetical protein
LATDTTPLASILDEDAQLPSVPVNAPGTGKTDHLAAATGSDRQLVAGLPVGEVSTGRSGVGLVLV